MYESFHELSLSLEGVRGDHRGCTVSTTFMREIETLTIPREAYFNILFVLPLHPLKFTASSHPQSFPCRPLTSGQHRSSPLTSRLIRKLDMFLDIRQ
jgi:hypothetical protein